MVRRIRSRKSSFTDGSVGHIGRWPANGLAELISRLENEGKDWNAIRRNMWVFFDRDASVVIS